MSSWKVKLTEDGRNAEVTVDLIDKIGWSNAFEFADHDAFLPFKGSFTNQTNRVVPEVQPSWVLEKFDIDDVKVGSTGTGDVLDSGGTYPNGAVNWEVIAKL